MEDPASTTTRSTRMERTSVRTVSTSAPAWTELLVASPSAPTWSFCPSWAARIQSGSRYPEDAVTSLSAPRRLSWWRNRWKSTEKTAACLKTTSLRGTSWAQSGEERPGLYLVSTLILDTASKATKWHVRAIILTPFVLNLVSRAAFRSHPVEHVLVAGVQCESQTTVWSPCSKSCGTGVSTRLTNSNRQCKLVKETRLCLIRPCSQMNRHLVLFAFTAI